MPNSKSAAKRLRQDKKRSERNLDHKRTMSYLLRQAKKQIEAKDRTKAWEFIYTFQKAIDQAVTKGFVHRNTAARKKSRLMAKFNTLK